MRVPFPGEGDAGLAPWEYTLAELFPERIDGMKRLATTPTW
jgi:hypothetical protein